ncbi:MAG TPA: acyl-ACP--UDP-N-acetylglucosamine O-acyltransferase [Verrucomicrobiae bacterium]|nr:acyl-ACP--UDP-N-acetylglucosamine O-acyltransferase [Verrucomicrobiae bacterium]
MSKIHPTAIVGKNVEFGPDNDIGPYVILEDNVKLGRGNILRAGAYIATGTEMGDENDVHMRAIIGHAPQDLAFKNEPTFTKIGNKNQIREFVTIHRGTKAGTSTVIGDQNFLMAYCHIAHNCQVGNRVVMVNQASLTGHCVVEDGAFLSGMTGLHQFTRVGRLAMLSALSAVNKDIPPFVMCGGRPAVALGINVVGMRRAGIDAASREEVKQAFKLLYRSGLNTAQALDAMKKTMRSKEVQDMVRFIEASDRGILDGASESDEDTLRPSKSARPRDLADLPADEPN